MTSNLYSLAVTLTVTGPAGLPPHALKNKPAAMTPTNSKAVRLFTTYLHTYN